MLQKQKRYQRFTKEGKSWTPWFNIPNNTPKEPIQFKGFKGNNLLNEYRIINI